MKGRKEKKKRERRREGEKDGGGGSYERVFPTQDQLISSTSL